jgi:hypothetical protein
VLISAAMNEVPKLNLYEAITRLSKTMFQNSSQFNVKVFKKTVESGIIRINER